MLKRFQKVDTKVAERVFEYLVSATIVVGVGIALWIVAKEK